eukprot:gene14255-biopygen5758
MINNSLMQSESKRHGSAERVVSSGDSGWPRLSSARATVAMASSKQKNSGSDDDDDGRSQRRRMQAEQKQASATARRRLVTSSPPRRTARPLPHRAAPHRRPLCTSSASRHLLHVICFTSSASRRGPGWAASAAVTARCRRGCRRDSRDSGETGGSAPAPECEAAGVLGYQSRGAGERTPAVPQQETAGLLNRRSAVSTVFRVLNWPAGM